MRGTSIGTLAFIALLLASSLAAAHHGWGYYDTGRPLYLSGRVTAVTWRNPHPELTINVVSAELPVSWNALPVPA